MMILNCWCLMSVVSKNKKEPQTRLCVYSERVEDVNCSSRLRHASLFHVVLLALIDYSQTLDQMLPNHVSLLC